MSLAKAIATATTKALVAALPKAVVAKFEDIDEQEFTAFLNEFLAEQLKGSGGRAPAAKGKNGKGRVTGYLLFSNEHRAQVKEDNPDIAFGDVGKELGKMWGKLTDKKKEVWNGKAKKQNEENGLLTGEAAKEAAKSKAAASKSKPAAKGKGKGKAAAKSKPAPTMKVTRDQAAKAWVIAGTKFAVQSPKNKVVVGKVSGTKIVALSAADKKKCAANGWELKPVPAKSKGKAAKKKDAEDEDEDEGTEDDEDDEGEEQDDEDDEDDEDEDDE